MNTDTLQMEYNYYLPHLIHQAAMNPLFVERNVVLKSSSGFENSLKKTIIESPLDISVNGKYWQSLLCTPVYLDFLVSGFLFNENVIKNSAQIKLIDICNQGKQVDIWLTEKVRLPRKLTRTSGCGKGSTGNIKTNGYNDLRQHILHHDLITQLMGKLLDSQDTYRSSGGVHASALSDTRDFWISMEDIGRHNTLDKLAGYCLLNSCFPLTSLILTTGRISSEMVQKASRIGSSIIVSRTSPTSLALQTADQLGMSIIGYAKKDRFIIYTHPEHLV